MRIACRGGGPAGLYFAIADPAHRIDLFERNSPDGTFGWGVVFSDQTVGDLIANDPVSGAAIRDAFDPCIRNPSESKGYQPKLAL